MQILEKDGLVARARTREEVRWIDVQFVPEAEAGDWVLVDRGWARFRIDALEAGRIDMALEALEAVSRGEEDVDHLFPDLANRTPELPEFLRPDRDVAPGGLP
jgi:hydrogenase maturation factor